MFSYIKTIRTYIFWSATSFIMISLCVPLALLPKKIRYNNKVYFLLTNLWSKMLIFFAFIFVKREDEKDLKKMLQTPSIIVMNHQSSLDIPLIESVLGICPRVWLAKSELGKIPILKILLKRMHVLVTLENPYQGIKALYKAYDLVKDKKSHLLVFPEGQRYIDGKVHDFFTGFAILAKKLNRPVVPIAVQGMHKIYPPKTLKIDSRASAVKLVVGEPFFYGEGETEKEFTKRVQSWFGVTLENLG